MSAASAGKRFGTQAEGCLNFGDDNLWWHGHAAADMGTGMDTFTIGNRGLNFLCQPSGHIELGHKDMFCILRGFANLFAWPRTERFHFDQPAPYTFVLQQTDGLSPLGNGGT